MRKALSFTATQRLTQKLTRAEKRLTLSRSDVIGLLIDLYADTVAVPDVPVQP